jgi:DNA mismatch repair protein MutH
MVNREYKTAEEVITRAIEAIDEPFGKIFQLAKEFQVENGLNEKRGKGDIGQAYEEGWFNYACNNDAKPDFEEADIEFKVTPFFVNSKGYRVKERLSLGKINYKEENLENYFESRFWKKNHHLIVMYYQYIKHLKREEFKVKRVDEIELDKLPRRDQEIIQHDWEKIAEAIKNGKAHTLTERDFTYLSPARKGAGGNETVKYNDDYPAAKPRAYSFKPSYMAQLFNSRIMKIVLL